ncbi:spermidine/putrescine ABC transporter ATP-binding subunit [Hoeflea sp. IMCC20628]|uniref:ABC transporter ATP-binding protein n=1 Tax=Hoeflea sp. IMCC20628 TaxID=1620421 RepID=UPI00063A8E13|nr:ABC transporter ATP-binding protein [Hoeflea sp. IMCC20628]AKI01830.1 spermidine/putrescine ABC transporter ATP-binding subunit [Hoeflea sp. IMCC20628]
MTGPEIVRDRKAAVSVRALSKTFGDGGYAVTALDAVELDILENEFFTLLGPSGCGKTTLLRLIAGFELPTNGVIALEGADITALPPHRRPINTVFQNYALFPHMTVAENIGFGLRMLGKPATEIKQTTERMLTLVQLEPLAGRRTDQLSGGQQQRVALARALAPAPKVLLLDEPLAALDLKLRKSMQLELKSLQAETGITFVFVTHDQEEALTMSDRIAVMKSGKILQIGSPRDIYDRPTHRFVADFIGDINILEGTVERLDNEVATVRLKDGTAVLAHLGSAAAKSGAVSIAIRPENVRLAKAGETPTLTGILENVVYFGAATNLHLRLATGEEIVIRNPGAVDEGKYQPGASIGAVMQPDLIRVLE